MKPKHLLALLSIAIAVLLLSGCGTISAASWPGVSYDSETNTVFVSYNTSVFAIDASNGQLKWSYPEKPSQKTTFYAIPVPTSDGQLLAGSYDNNLYSLDKSTGAQKWVFDPTTIQDTTNRFISSPLVYNDTIYAPNADERLYALDMQGNPVWDQPFQANQALWAAPAADPKLNLIYLTSMDRNIYALNPDTGALVWSTPMEGASVGSPTVDPNGNLYVGNFANQLLAVNPQDGSTTWQVDTNGWVWSGPILGDSQLFFGDLDRTFYAVNANDGSIAWQITPDGQVVGQPALAGNNIFFGTESGTLYVVDLRGNIVKSIDLSGSIYTSPVLAGDLIVVAPYQTDNLLVAFDQNGNQQWTFTPAK